MKRSPNNTVLYKYIGKYRNYTVCRFCFSDNLEIVMKFGEIPLAGGFLKQKKDFSEEKYYPLDIAFCKNCYLLQSVNVIEADTLFRNYFYHSSSIKTLVSYFESIAKNLGFQLKNRNKPFVVEIGCNDGGFIQSLKNKHIASLGIDPASNIVLPLIKKGYPIINDYFSLMLAKKIAKTRGKADIIISFNTFAHIEDMHTIIKGVKHLLKRGGILMFQVHYLGNVLFEKQYDMIYHEHQYYYSILTLQKFFSRFGMEIYDVEFGRIHAGSVMFYVQNKDYIQKYRVTDRVKKGVIFEKKNKFDDIETYKHALYKIEKTKKNLLKLLVKIKSEYKTIAGYGASGRATIIMNYCGIGANFLDYVIDDAPAKQGAYTPGNHLKIVNSNILTTNRRPDYILLFAWSFYEEVVKRNKHYLETGGIFIIPLPKIKILKK